MTSTSQGSETNYSDNFTQDDPQFLEALGKAVLPGDVPENPKEHEDQVGDSQESEELEPPPPAQPSLKRKRSPLIVPEKSLREDEGHLYDISDEEDDTYGASKFGGWGDYMRRKRAKLQIQNKKLKPSAEEKVQVFDGLSIYINGWTQPSVQFLRELIVQHGGMFQPYLDKKSLATHIITCSLTPAKIREFKHMKVVRPEWLTESVAHGILLNWKDYQFLPTKGIDVLPGTMSNQPTIRSHISQSTSANPVPDPVEDVTPPQSYQSLHPTNSKQPSGLVSPSTMNNASPTEQPNHLTPVTPLTASSPFKHLETPPAPPPGQPKAGPSSFIDALRQPPRAIDPLYVTDPGTKKDAARVPGYASDKSNPNAQRAMAKPEWRKANTAASSDFMDGYYKNSRLHHLSTWKAELKDLVKEAQERAEAGPTTEHAGKIADEGASGKPGGFVLRSPSGWKGKGKAVEGEERTIMHCDFDCFFVAAGLVSRPEFKGKPVVVCHSQGAQGGASSTSEIASSSYEARAFGIKNGMSLQQARQLCPAVVTIPYEFERYKQLSLLFYTVLMQHADDLQAVSVDEALIDVSATVNQMKARHSYDDPSFDPAKVHAEKIRAEIRKLTSCEVSIGIAHNILFARLATRRAKPGGSYHLLPAEIPEFLEPLEISDLHGLGYHTKQKALEKLGTIKLGDLRNKSKGTLIDAMGKSTGETLYNALRGIDNKELESDKPRKSVSCDITYGIRFENNEEAEAFVRQMAGEVKRRLDAVGMVGRSLTLKIMKRDPTAPVEPAKFLGHGPCALFNRQTALAAPGGRVTSDDQIIGDHAWRLLKSFNFDPKELRGIGIQVQKLEGPSSKAPQGQGVLDFKSKTVTSTRPGTSALSVAPASTKRDDDVQMGDPVKPSSTNKIVNVVPDLPSFSQVDMSVFEALPDDLRKELENEYKRRESITSGVGSSITLEPNPPAPVVKRPSVPPPASKFGRRSATPSIFPAKPGGARPNHSRIAQQLAPRTRSNVSPKKSGLYDRNALHIWAQKKKEPPRVKITDAALRNLKLDPEVFFALPINVQREQLIMARIIKEKGALPEPPKERKILKPRKLVLPANFPVWRAPKPKARHPTPPVLRQQGKSKKEKLSFTETDDIQRILETWITTYRHWAPREKDVEYLSKYLLHAIDGKKMSDVSVERAIAVMKWWLVLSRRFWPASEIMEEEDLASSQRDLVGEAWWAAFRRVKEQMDTIARARFGGKLAIR